MRTALMIAMAVTICGVLPAPAWAQDPSGPAAPRAYRGGGLAVTVAGARRNDGAGSGAGGVTVQFTIANVSANRLYFYVVGNQNAILSNGASLYLRSVTGVAYCSQDAGYDEISNITKCLANRERSDNINYYTYLDPGDTLPTAFLYSSINPMQPLGLDTAISISVDCVVRSGPTDQQALGAEAQGGGISGPRIVQVHLPSIVVTAR